jgi:hypothetical protein
MPEEAGLLGGPLATQAGRTTSSQPDLSGSTAHGEPQNTNSVVRQDESAGGAQYEEGSEYYDEEQEGEIEAEVKQLGRNIVK